VWIETYLYTVAGDTPICHPSHEGCGGLNLCG